MESVTEIAAGAAPFWPPIVVEALGAETATIIWSPAVVAVLTVTAFEAAAVALDAVPILYGVLTFASLAGSVNRKRPGSGTALPIPIEVKVLSAIVAQKQTVCAASNKCGCEA